MSASAHRSPVKWFDDRDGPGMKDQRPRPIPPAEQASRDRHPSAAVPAEITQPPAALAKPGDATLSSKDLDELVVPAAEGEDDEPVTETADAFAEALAVNPPAAAKD